MVTFPRTQGVIEKGIAEGLHLGAQLYVSRAGKPLIDAAFGEAREGYPMTSDILTLWFSAGKPLTAVAIGQLVERGKLQWTTRIAEIIPAFAAHGKEEITVRHVITHTAGLHAADKLEPPWLDRIARICDTAVPAGWVPGTRAAYSSAAGWYILGEIVARITVQQVSTYVREQIALPAGLNNTYLCLDAESIESERERLGFIYDTSGRPLPLDFWNSDEGLQRCIPGGSARGPIRELGRFYENLVEGGGALLSAEMVALMTARQRVAILDETFQYKIDCGLGFILNSNRDGLLMPYGYGREASHGTFGHSGNQSSCAFADPDRRLVVAWACNGMPGERRHQQRQRAINDAIFADIA